MSKKKVKRDVDDNKKSFEDKLAASIATNPNKKSSDLKAKDNEPDFDVDDTVHAHQKLEFLFPENIRDAKKRRPDHPEYDMKTLYVPETFLNTLTPVGIFDIPVNEWHCLIE